MITVTNRISFLIEVGKLLPKFFTAAELGCYKGQFSKDILDGLKPSCLYMIDPFKRGGKQCGHDYIEHPDFGVIQAVDEFCSTYNFEMIIFNENGGDYALRRCTQ